MADYYYADYVGQTTTLDGLNGVGIKAEDTGDIVWKWTDPETPDEQLRYYLVPAYTHDAGDISIVSYTRDFQSGNIIVKFRMTNDLLYYDSEQGKTHDDLIVNYRIDFYINGEPVYTDLKFNSNGTNRTADFDLEIPIDTNKENVEVKVIQRDNVGLYEETDTFQFKKQSGEIDLDFTNTDSQTVIYPIYIDDEQKKYESFTITNLSNGITTYPRVIEDLLSFEYDDQLNNELPIIYDDKAWISGMDGMSGIVDEDGKPLFKTKWINDGDKYKLVVDDNFFYNTDERKVYLGVNSYYETYNSLLLPTSYYDNIGKITYYFDFVGYRDYNIKITLPIGNKYPISGEDGRYEFIEDINSYNENGEHVHDEVANE